MSDPGNKNETRREIRDVVLTIPAYEPDERMPALVKELRHIGFAHIIVVNDGSGAASEPFFKEVRDVYGCVVREHSENRGYGRALKTGAEVFLELFGDDPEVIGLVQCDCDGQHAPADILRCAEALRSERDSIVIGTRDFSDDDIPWKSRFGNRLTGLIFRVFVGMDIGDTQSGLRGIPKGAVDDMLKVPGEKMEFTTSLLLEAKKNRIPVHTFPIETIYNDGNSGTHFDPFGDSVRIYGLILKYCLSSLSAFAVDIILFAVFSRLLKGIMPEMHIPVATYAARVLSCVYTFFVNKKLVFASDGGARPGAVWRFAALAVFQATVSGFATRAMAGAAGGHAVPIKILVDTALFFFSFQVQRKWVFAEDRGDKI